MKSLRCKIGGWLDGQVLGSGDGAIHDLYTVKQSEERGPQHGPGSCSPCLTVVRFLLLASEIFEIRGRSDAPCIARPRDPPLQRQSAADLSVPNKGCTAEYNVSMMGMFE